MTKAPETIAQSDSSRSPGNTGRRWALLVVLIAGCVYTGLAVVFDCPVAALSTGSPEPTQEPSRDFSRFSHNNPSHERLPCLLCHRREINSPRPVRSAQHTPCAGCHAQQFAASSGPICTICHTKVESGGHEVRPFPSLKSFSMTFAHARHRNVACATCHKPMNRGVEMSIPSGAGAHTTCYQCHTPRAQANGRDISSCSTCHKPGQYSRASTSGKAFRVNFGHEQHKRRGVSCLECHKITSLAARTAQVSSPMPTEHPASQSVQSCETCHNDQRAFGIASFSNCKRCHQGPTFRF
jgi:c(7)-type cytochrome triheme protein